RYAPRLPTAQTAAPSGVQQQPDSEPSTRTAAAQPADDACQIRTVPSSLTVAIHDPVGSTAQPRTGPACPMSSPVSCPVTRSQIRAVASPLVVTTQTPSGETAQSLTQPSCPAS